MRLLRREPDFARLYIAQLISFAGDWFAQVALLGLILELSGSAAIAAMLLVLQNVPFVIASPVAGVVADRFDRRRTLVVIDVVRAVLALGFLLARTPETLWIAFAVAATMSIGAAFFEPASAAALPNLVDHDQLPAANVLVGAAWGTMLAVGAAIGGIVTVVFGREVAFVIDGLSFLVSALLILAIHRPLSAPNIPEAGAATPRASMAIGVEGAVRTTIRFARESRLAAAFLLAKATFGVGAGVLLILAVFGSQVYQAGDVGIGLLFGARGLGALIGPFLARAVLGVDDRGIVRIIGVSFLGFNLAYLLVGFAPGLWIAAALVFLAHLGGGSQWTLSTYGLQRTAPDPIRGRVFAIDFALVSIAMTVSTLASGLLVEALGPHAALLIIVGGGAIAAISWIAWTWQVRDAAPSEVPITTS